MSKIPFGIKFRPQIESGEYKVVTGDDRQVRIISWDKKVFGGRYEIVALVPTTQGDTEAVQLYCPDGTLISSNWNEKFKLFIVTPEPELTEYESNVRTCITENLTTHINDGNGTEMSSTVFIDDDTTKKLSSELLSIARKQLQPEIDAMLEDAYKTADEVQYRKGREEALKDLPRWRKMGRMSYYSVAQFVINGRYLEMNDTLNDVYEIALSDLAKLPKEDSHE